MLVRLYALSDVAATIERVAAQNIMIRRAMAHERDDVVDWVRQHFPQESRPWGSEVAIAVSRTPATCYVAIRDRQMLGFACFDATALGFFGPTGTAESERGLGIGAALLVASLRAMSNAGYAYAIIGGVGEQVRGFYERCVGATEIVGSTPGIYGKPIQL
ncbi:MAG TPA: GNAT family N-acetyltransferase [Woeseiaceae bacterium]|nr:GNAT family N-acetyltransferase [Woeseiaceae bacterium]